ncbi:Phage major tail protein [Anopheles sinensis]|uniref:Phage major tail protein n=1 Tax=Anopheles sinensis TaxID=74873 RepID=A0A084WU75_ANOSI|nr:Phage major tail protein [Anopheles sinensis]
MHPLGPSFFAPIHWRKMLHLIFRSSRAYSGTNPAKLPAPGLGFLTLPYTGPGSRNGSGRTDYYFLVGNCPSGKLFLPTQESSSPPLGCIRDLIPPSANGVQECGRSRTRDLSVVFEPSGEAA